MFKTIFIEKNTIFFVKIINILNLSFAHRIDVDQQEWVIKRNFGMRKYKHFMTSVTRFGYFLDFGQLFKAFGRN